MIRIMKARKLCLSGQTMSKCKMLQGKGNRWVIWEKRAIYD